MKVLNLLTSDYIVYKKQKESLERHDVYLRELTVPNEPPRTPLDYIKFYPEVLRTSLERKFDLIHANFGLTAPYAIAQPIRPMVVTLWGSDLQLFLKNNKQGLLARNICRIDLFDEVIVRNKKMKRKVREIFGTDAHIIPSGIDLERFVPIEKIEAQKKIGWNPQKKHVLFLTSKPSREEKNYPLAKKVVEDVKKRTNSNIELKYVFKIPHEKVPFYLNAADLLLLTSKYEGSPNTVKEAMACNTPVVSTDVGDVSYLLKDVKLSKVSQNKEELVKNVIDVLKNDEGKSNGRKRIKKLELGLDSIGKNILRVYQKALEN